MNFRLELQIANPVRDRETLQSKYVWRKEVVFFDAGIPTSPHECCLVGGFQFGLRGMPIWERSHVKAWLEVPEVWRNEKFVLQAGLDPDKTLTFSRFSIQDGVMNGMASDDNVEDVNDDDGVELFYDTMGPTCLFLRREKGLKVADLLSINIEVRPSAHREKIMRAVVDELISLAPHSLSSDPKAQNKSAYDDVWSVGATSFAHPITEFNAIRDLLFKLNPILSGIVHNPAVMVARAEGTCLLSRARQLSRHEERRMRGVLNQWGVDRLGDLHVRGIRNVCGYDIPAHRSMFCFLKLIDGRLIRLKHIAEAGKSSALADVRDMRGHLMGVSDNKKNYERFRHACMPTIKEKLCVAREARDLERNVNHARHELRTMLRLDIFRGFEESVNAELMGIDFLYNAHYRQFYTVASAFLQKHHWWKPLEEGSGLTHAKVLLSNGKYANEQQRKYSILFEYWCCWRLIDAFEKIGFSFGEARTRLREKLAESIVVDEDYESFIPQGGLESESLEVYVIHNYAAYDKSIYPEASFLTVPRRRHPLSKDPAKRLMCQCFETPDLALVIRNKSTQKWYWITLDAKSTSYLSARQVMKQWNYLHQKHIPAFDLESEQMPAQSWLVYAGSEDCPCGLEGVAGEDLDFRCWKSDDAAEIERIFNDVNVRECSVEKGWSPDPKRPDRKFLGEIRASPLTSPLVNANTSNSAFLQFVQLQLQTARRILG